MPGEGGQAPINNGANRSPFFARFNGLVDDLLPTLSGRELKVLLVFIRHANNQTGETIVTPQTIAKKTRIHARTVRQIIDDLERRGLLVVIDGGGGRNHPARRRVETCAIEAHESRPETCANLGAETCADLDAKPAPFCAETSASEALQTASLSASSSASSSSPAAPSPDDDDGSNTSEEILEALRAAGVRGTNRTKLARMNISAEAVTQIAAHVKADGGRGGILFKTLLSDGERVTAELRAERERAAERRRLLAQQTAEEEEKESKREEFNKWLDAEPGRRKAYFDNLRKQTKEKIEAVA